MQHFLQHLPGTAASFGNARGVRNLFEKILVQQSNRLATVEMVTRESLMELTLKDVQDALEEYTDHTK